MITYEDRLNADLDWAFSEGSRHFENRSQVHVSMRRIARNLRAMEIPYAVIGPMALFAHGYRRFTEVVDVLLSRDGLKSLPRRRSECEFEPARRWSKHLRDKENGVLIAMHVVGDYLREQNTQLPMHADPSTGSVEIDGIRYLELPQLVELLLAFGMSRAKGIHLSDVQEAIRHLALPLDLMNEFHPAVKDKYGELWNSMRSSPPMHAWRIKAEHPLPCNATWDDAGVAFPTLVSRLDAMQADGVSLETCPGDVYTACFLTRDSEVARRFGFLYESD